MQVLMREKIHDRLFTLQLSPVEPENTQAMAAGEDTTAESAEPFLMPLSAQDLFFGFQPLTNTRPAPRRDQETPEGELERYLTQVDRSWTEVACFGGKKPEFPRLAQLFLRLNTALPSSANVERFFSRVGLSFSAIRNALGDATLEKEVLLSLNRRYWAD